MDFSKIFPNKVEKALNYMNKIYGGKFSDSFELVDSEPAGFTSLADNFTMTSQKFPDCYIRVTHSSGKYTTNYMQIYHYQQYQDYMQNLCEEIFGECKVLYNVYIYSTPVYNENTTFEEFLHNDKSLKNLVIFMPDIESIDNKVAELLIRLKEREVPLGGITFESLANYSDSNSFANINDWTLYQKKNFNSIQNYINFAFERDYSIRYRKEGDFLA